MQVLKMAIVASFTAIFAAGCASTGMQMGNPEAKTVATGSAAGSAVSAESAALEKCTAPLGTVSLIENQAAGWYTILRNEYRLPPTANLLKLLIQQSNCFVVVERGGAGMAAINRERELQNSGELRGGSKFGKGQIVSSDYGLSPEIVFSQDNTGGMAGALGGLLGGHRGHVLGAIGARTQTREASALLTLIDNRSSVQIAASEGSASKTDWGGFGALFGGGAGAGLSGYSTTPQGKVITAAFMDAYNQMVRALRNYKSQEVKGDLGKGGQLKIGQ